MKKILSFLFGFLVLFTGFSYGYDINQKDYDLIITITNKFEDYISNKGENYRNIILNQIKIFGQKYKDNERIQTLLGEIIKNIQTSDNIKIKQKILSELQNKGIPDLKFMYSTGALQNTPFLLNKLLEEKRVKFNVLINTPIDKVNFDLIEQYNQDNALSYLFGLLNNYESVDSNDQIRDIINSFQDKYSEFANEQNYSKRYYDIYKKLQLDTALDVNQKRIIDMQVKIFELDGINLSQDKISRLKEIKKQLNSLEIKFGENLLDAQKDYSYYIDKIDAIKDMPQDVLDTAHGEAQKKGKDGYLFTYNTSDYLMSYSTDEAVRRAVRKDYKTLASSGDYDNRPVIIDILKLRDEMSKILGFKNYGEYSLADKMAEKPEIVIKQENDILVKATQKADKDIQEIKDYFGLTGLNIRDVGYYSRILKEQKYAVDDNKLRDYFEFNNVKKGLFDIVNTLYGFEMRKIDMELYNPDIQAYEVYRKGKLIGYYILDPFYNPNKASGAWADNLRLKRSSSSEVLPIVMNVLNIQKGETHTLLTYGEVTYFFHEFGHAIHSLSYEGRYSELKSFGVEWDFVELPSQLMENWAYGDGLKKFAYNYKTGEAISDELIQKLSNLRTFMSGISTITQLIYSRIDMTLHTSNVLNTPAELDKEVYSIIDKISYFKGDIDNKNHASFSHIFDGGYSAGYYSYMRAEVIESDVFSVFRENGMFDKNTSEKFFDTILSKGSTKPAIQLFKDFMGRDIQLDGFYSKKGF